jgi:hypothetical protein
MKGGKIISKVETAIFEWEIYTSKLLAFLIQSTQDRTFTTSKYKSNYN